MYSVSDISENLHEEVMIPHTMEPINEEAMEHSSWSSIAHNFESKCWMLKRELAAFEKHFALVGGTRLVSDAARATRFLLTGPVNDMKNMVKTGSTNTEKGLGAFVTSLDKYCQSVRKFRDSLYHHNHGFHFREIDRFLKALADGHSFIKNSLRSEGEKREYIMEKLTPEMAEIIVCVTKELQVFAEKVLPSFVSESNERATTRYLTLTTIATFFSSVTATTLQTQISLQQPTGTLSNVVYLCWFLSLVFSVASGINSLLGMTWRRSSIFHTWKPSETFVKWLENAPMVFLVISASFFIIGLNLFAYLFLSNDFVSITTTIFTFLHMGCLLIVTFLFLLNLKRTHAWAQWIFRRWQRVPYHRVQAKRFLLSRLRNFYWSFGFDNHLVNLNWEIKLRQDVGLFPKTPSRLAGFFRKRMRSTSIALSNLSKVFRRVFGMPDSKQPTDLESGNVVSQELQAPERATSPSVGQRVETAKSMYSKLIGETFSDESAADRVVHLIENWRQNSHRHSIEDLEAQIRVLFWGYDDLITAFEECKHSLVSEQSKTKPRRNGAVAVLVYRSLGEDQRRIFRDRRATHELVINANSSSILYRPAVKRITVS